MLHFIDISVGFHLGKENWPQYQLVYASTDPWKMQQLEQNAVYSILPWSFSYFSCARPDQFYSVLAFLIQWCTLTRYHTSADVQWLCTCPRQMINYKNQLRFHGEMARLTLVTSLFAMVWENWHGLWPWVGWYSVACSLTAICLRSNFWGFPDWFFCVAEEMPLKCYPKLNGIYFLLLTCTYPN